MRSTSFATHICYIVALFFLTCTGLAQAKPRIAVFPFDDRTTSNKDMNIGTKVADLLIAKLTTNGAFAVYDRQYVDRLLAEKDRKYDPNYDSAVAAKSGLMGTVDMVVSGQIDAFNANATQVVSGKFVTKRVETDGAVVLKVTARLISVERGSIIMAPSANAEQKGVLAKADTVAPLITKHLPGSKDGLDINQQHATNNTDQALRKLVDEAADEVTKQLATQVAQAAATVQVITTPPPPPAPKPESHPSLAGARADFVGISDGLAYIDKGSAAGVKVGQKIAVRRSVNTGLKNSGGEAILRHKAVCTLLVSVVEEGSAAGKCVPEPTAHGQDGVPHPGDEIIIEPK
ncbi:CsgG/HfaB family protein [Granulicella sp. dw_53]|uniref:CsgG/HfaB family protein n=1 Tax=Granulicella sp. dw_53 TaxID=2719792 RepID=UPI001BD2475C|nr:CsgG/HfaB family protein [Granulicella sp. dw_53]